MKVEISAVNARVWLDVGNNLAKALDGELVSFNPDIRISWHKQGSFKTTTEDFSLETAIRIIHLFGLKEGWEKKAHQLYKDASQPSLGRCVRASGLRSRVDCWFRQEGVDELSAP